MFHANIILPSSREQQKITLMMTMVIEMIVMMMTAIAMTMMNMATVTDMSTTCQVFTMKMVTI